MIYKCKRCSVEILTHWQNTPEYQISVIKDSLSIVKESLDIPTHEVPSDDCDIELVKEVSQS